MGVFETGTIDASGIIGGSFEEIDYIITNIYDTHEEIMNKIVDNKYIECYN